MADQNDMTHQFDELLTALTATTGQPLRLTKEDLLPEQVGIDAQDAKAKMITNLALNSSLTKEAASVVVEKAMKANNDNPVKAAAQIVSQVAAPSGSVELQLSMPNPLDSRWRIRFTIAMIVILIVSICLLMFIKNRTTAEYVAGAILGSLAWLSIVLFVMGYQSVNVKGSTGSADGSSASKSSSDQKS